MGKRANIRATRYASEASERELRRQTEIAEEMRRAGMTADERVADDEALAARAAAAAELDARSMALAVGALVALGGSVLIGQAVGFWGLLLCWSAVAAIVVIRRRNRAAEAARAVAEAEAAEAARRDQEAARRAQVEHHVRMLCAVDPVFVALTDEWRKIPPTRPADRAENEARQRERLIIIDEYAARFAELERTGQPVPDHATTMRGLVAAEQSWDGRDRAERARPPRRLGLRNPGQGA